MTIVKNYNYLLVRLPKLTVINFYLKSILVGLWVLFKWFLNFLWKSVNQKRINYMNPNDGNHRRNNNNTKQLADQEITYSESDHNRPPSCLVDSTYGRHSYVKLKGVKLHYIEAGNKNDPIILLLHGYPDCWLGWRKQIPDLANFFRVIVVDLKGFNDSDKPLWRNEYKPEQICRELNQFIKVLGANTATIVGHDLGALIGWMFAYLYPDSIDRFICVSTSHPNLYWDNLSPKSPFNKQFLQFSQLPYLPELELSSPESTHLERNFAHLEKNERHYSVARKTNGSTRRKNSENPEDDGNIMDAYRYLFSRKNDWTGPLNYFRNFPFYRIRENELIRCPCLIVTGNADSMCKLETVIKSTDYCDNFLVKIIEGANHWPHQENADEFNRVMLKFLVGRRATQLSPEAKSPSKGIISRMFGAVTNNGVKIGGYVLDSVQQKTNETILGAIQS